MKFVIIEVSDGGAECDVHSTVDSVTQYLETQPLYWAEAIKNWKEWHRTPGQWMEYPCGWIFVVNS